MDRGGVSKTARCVGLAVPLLARLCSLSFRIEEGVSGDEGSRLLRFIISVAALLRWGTCSDSFSAGAVLLRTRRGDAVVCTALASTSATLKENVWFMSLGLLSL